MRRTMLWYFYKCNDVMEVNPMLAKPESNVYTFNTVRKLIKSPNEAKLQKGT